LESETKSAPVTSQFFADFSYLPLLHTLVEERAGERR
jgi:hypothetical protein